MNFREGHRRQVAELTARAENITQGKEIYAFRHPDDPTRIVKIAQPVAKIHSPGRDGLKLRPYNRERPPAWVRREFLKQYLLTRILHQLYPDEVPDAFNVKTKSIPRTEKQFIEGKTIFEFRASDTEFPLPPLYYERDPFIVEDGEDFEELWKVFQVMSKWAPAFRRMRNRMQDLGILIDPVNIGRNFLRLDDGTFVYVDNFVSPDPKRTAELLRPKIDAMGQNVTDAQKATIERAKARCEHWLEQYEKLAAHRTKIEALWDQLVTWTQTRRS